LSSATRAALRKGATDAPTIPLAEVLGKPLANGKSVPTRAGGFPVLRLTALGHGGVNLSARKEGAWTRDQGSKFRVLQGDFLVARGNGSLSLVGRGGLVVDEPDEVAFPDTMIRVRPDPRLMNSRYLRIVWNSDGVRRQVERAARTSAGIYKVSQADLRAVRVPCPPLGDQERIVRVFEATESGLDSLAVSIDSATRRADGLRQAVLRDAFLGLLVSESPPVAIS
jgi:type I restriction enzyme S subunit